jgi:hypothetical protein
VALAGIEIGLFSTSFWLLAVGIAVLVVAVGWLLIRINPTLADLWWAAWPVLLPAIGIAVIAGLAL